MRGDGKDRPAYQERSRRDREIEIHRARVSPGSLPDMYTGTSRASRVFILKCERKITPSRHTGHRQFSAHLISADAESLATILILLRGTLEASDFVARRSDTPVEADLWDRTTARATSSLLPTKSACTSRVVVHLPGERREAAPLGTSVNHAPVSLEARLRVVNLATLAAPRRPFVDPVTLRRRFEREMVPEPMTLLEADRRYRQSLLVATDSRFVGRALAEQRSTVVDSEVVVGELDSDLCARVPSLQKLRQS